MTPGCLRRAAVACLCGLATIGLAACGKRGSPQPPLRPVPVAIADLAIERGSDSIQLRFTVPASNTDPSIPAAVDRVEIFALTQPAGSTVPTPEQLLIPANLIATIAVRPRESEKPDPDAKDKPVAAAKQQPDARPAPGEAAVHAEAIKPDALAKPQVRYYAAVPATGRRRGAPTAIIAVPLSAVPASPAGVSVDYTEQVLALTWQPPAGATRFLLEETGEAGRPAKRLSASPLDKPAFEMPVVFGPRRCFVVRSVTIQGPVSIVGEGSEPICVTPSDRFPPPVPGSFVALPLDEGIDLTWSAVTAADLAGYIVLRGDGPNGTLQRLQTAPIAETTYRDRTAASGRTYSYAVIAVDKAANVSNPSTREVVTARDKD